MIDEKISLNEMVIDGTISRESASKIVAAAQRGESFLIFGQKYAGKTTLAKCIAEISRAVICDDIFDVIGRTLVTSVMSKANFLSTKI